MNTTQKDNVLNTLAQLILDNKEEIIAQNKIDVSLCSPEKDPSIFDRLIVDEKKVIGMADAVKKVIELNDPEGKVIQENTHPNGMKIENRVVPFGKILIIYESRPDVTIEAAITAFKAGNKILLKGGKEAKNTNLFLVKLWKGALEAHGQDTSYVTYLDLPREKTQELIMNKLEKIDLIIPRGGEGLINFVKQNSNVPVIVSGRGNNFLYVDKNVDFEMAVNIILNGKSRISVCNALDKVLINKSLDGLEEKVNALVSSLQEKDIKVYADKDIATINTDTEQIANEDIFAEEFLDAKIVLSTIDGLDESIAKINQYSGGHSATIVTNDLENAVQFQNEVDCAAVYHNASTRFTDGGQFGFGAEIAISTQKLHFRGPLGLAELVTNKWFISGNGQVRD